MDLKLAAFRALLRDPSGDYTAVAVAVAALVTLGLVVVLALIASVLPGRHSPEGDGENTGADTSTELPVRRRKRLGYAGAAVVTVIAVAGAIGAGALWYRDTSSTAYCAQSCHSMSKAVLSWQNSPHAAVPCTRCHESANRRAIPQIAATRLYYVYLQITGGSARANPVPTARCIACHNEVLDTRLTARNGEIFTHRSLLEETSSCATCHGQQGHKGLRK